MPDDKRSQVWILTGGIACGKSSCLKRLGELLPNAKIFSADAEVHVQLTNPDTIGTLVESFGEVVLSPDGSIDRGKLRAAIFSCESSRKKLEHILHPLVRHRFDEEVKVVISDTQSDILLAEIPLFYETGGTYPADRVVCVVASQEVQIERLRAKRGINRQQAKDIIQTQLPAQQKAAQSDICIWNDGTEAVLYKQVERLASAWHQTFPNQS